MSWAINAKEYENVVRLAPKARYEYFIKKVADWRESGDENESVPVWPHRLYADAMAVGEWLDYEPRKISLDDWLETWIPNMAMDARMVAVFPAIEGNTVTVEPRKLQADIEQELATYGV